MIFPTGSAIKARERLNELLDAGAKPEEVYQQALELDPNDGLALFALGWLRKNEGDLKGAEELAWRGLQAYPGNHRFYTLLCFLAGTGPKNRALADGLMELGYRRLAANYEEFDKTREQLAAELKKPSSFEINTWGAKGLISTSSGLLWRMCFSSVE